MREIETEKEEKNRKKERERKKTRKMQNRAGESEKAKYGDREDEK